MCLIILSKIDRAFYQAVYHSQPLMLLVTVSISSDNDDNSKTVGEYIKLTAKDQPVNIFTSKLVLVGQLSLDLSAASLVNTIVIHSWCF